MTQRGLMCFTIFGAVSLLGCERDPEVVAPTSRGDAPAVEVPGPSLRRLTSAQYRNTIADLFGDDVVIATSLEPDEAVDGLLTVGASVVTISSLGVERYETAAFTVAEQVLGDAGKRAALVPCTPEGSSDEACAAEALAQIGRRVWRRPLSDAELEVLVTVSDTAAVTLGDFYGGLVYGVAALLQSPYFLFLVESGEDDPERPGARRYTDYEMASRLSYFLWNTAPDLPLLEAAAAGELTDDAGLSATIERLLADDRARQGLENFVDEMFTLYEVEDISKDPTVFVHYSDDLGASARAETLMDVERLVFDEDGDYRDLFTSTETHLDRKLAALYGVAAPSEEGFALASLPREGGRRGLLGTVSVLAQYSHPTSTSPTKRGRFVREVLLCQPLPDPPGDVATVLPEASGDAPTLRDRLEQHREDPTCAVCHDLTDPVGLALENFDGVGGWRDEDNGAPVDASGALDGVAYDDAWELAAAVAEHSRVPGCLTATLYRYANGRVLDDAEDDLIDWHTEGFVEADHRVLSLMADIASSPGFRSVGAVE